MLFAVKNLFRTAVLQAETAAGAAMLFFALNAIYGLWLICAAGRFLKRKTVRTDKDADVTEATAKMSL